MAINPKRVTLALAFAFIVASFGVGSDASKASPRLEPPTDAQRAAAATATANANPMCAEGVLGAFYWEIGDVNGAEVSGAVGTGVQSTTIMPIASASKWVYSTYVLQKVGSVRTADVPYLNFTSGYTQFNDSACNALPSTTIASCLGTQTGQIPGTIGKFSYGSGHFENHAVSVMGIGGLNSGGLTSEVASTVGDFGFDYANVNLAGGIKADASGYGAFLRSMLSGSLVMKDSLGLHEVCADPTSCPTTAVNSPVSSADTGEVWGYSLGHWVEDDPTVGDHAYSSAGAFGFYPWIDKSKTYYGVLARKSQLETNAGYHSAQCGRLIRQAWMTGQTVLSTTPAGAGIATIVANPYGTVMVEGATLNGNTISNFQPNVLIQLGTTPGVTGSFAQIDWQGLSLAPGTTLTIRSGGAGQSVVLRNANGAVSAISGALVGQGGNGAAPPALYVANAAGINLGSGGVMQSSSGLVLDTLGNNWIGGANIINAGVADGGTQLGLYGAAISGGGAFKGNTIAIATFGSAKNPVNGTFFLSNSLQLFPGTGDSLSLVLNAYGNVPQVLNLMANGNVSVWMPSAWPAGYTAPQNNAVLQPGGVWPPGQPESAFGGGSMIVQATGNLQLVDGGTDDFVFPGSIVFKAAGTIDIKGVVVNQGWNTGGKAFQGVYFESPVIGSSIGKIEVYSNDLNWTNFSTFPGAPVRVSTLVRNPDGSASYASADAMAPHLNTYSILVDAAAKGQCWICLTNNQPVNMYGP
ncbi:MAG: hypothetical protein ABI593_05010 [Betaproteobacteria bacterium]